MECMLGCYSSYPIYKMHNLAMRLCNAASQSAESKGSALVCFLPCNCHYKSRAVIHLSTCLWISSWVRSSVPGYPGVGTALATHNIKYPLGTALATHNIKYPLRKDGVPLIFLSTLLRRSVYDIEGRRLGTLHDLSVSLNETFPAVTA